MSLSLRKGSMIRSPEIERRSDVNLSDLFVVSFSYAIGLGAEDERKNKARYKRKRKRKVNFHIFTVVSFLSASPVPVFAIAEL